VSEGQRQEFYFGGNMVLRFLSACALFFWPLAAVDAQEKPTPGYDVLLEQVKKADPKADFLKLRMAFTETASYKPYDPDRETQKRMAEAFQKKEYGKAIESGEKLLKTCYVDLEAHFALSRAYTQLGKADQAKFHRYVFDGLVQSTLKSGDGKTPATAFVVISTDEEYAVLGVWGARRTRQALLDQKGQKFDQVDGVDQKSKERVRLYFNVTKPFSWLAEQLKKDK
jgi:hypothetical protein